MPEEKIQRKSAVSKMLILRNTEFLGNQRKGKGAQQTTLRLLDLKIMVPEEGTRT